jgi:hypothetical protein
VERPGQLASNAHAACANSKHKKLLSGSVQQQQASTGIGISDQAGRALPCSPELTDSHNADRQQHCRLGHLQLIVERPGQLASNAHTARANSKHKKLLSGSVQQQQASTGIGIGEQASRTMSCRPHIDVHDALHIWQIGSNIASCCLTSMSITESMTKPLLWMCVNAGRIRV